MALDIAKSEVINRDIITWLHLNSDIVIAGPTHPRQQRFASGMQDVMHGVRQTKQASINMGLSIDHHQWANVLPSPYCIVLVNRVAEGAYLKHFKSGNGYLDGQPGGNVLLHQQCAFIAEGEDSVSIGRHPIDVLYTTAGTLLHLIRTEQVLTDRVRSIVIWRHTFTGVLDVTRPEILLELVDRLPNAYRRATVTFSPTVRDATMVAGIIGKAYRRIISLPYLLTADLHEQRKIDLQALVDMYGTDMRMAVLCKTGSQADNLAYSIVDKDGKSAVSSNRGNRRRCSEAFEIFNSQEAGIICLLKEEVKEVQWFMVDVLLNFNHHKDSYLEVDHQGAKWIVPAAVDQN